MKPTTKDAYKLMHDGTIAHAQIEANGMRIDVPRLDKTIEKVSRRIGRLSERLRSGEVYDTWRRVYGGKANLGSRDQLARILFEVLKLPCVSYTSGGTSGKPRPQADKAALERVDLPFVKDYLEVERLKKLKGTYLDGVRREVVDGYLRPSFNLHLARTYRPSSDSPNFQNIPVRDELAGKLIRRCFVPRPGHVLVEMDYCLSGDTRVETIDGPRTIVEIVGKVKKGESVWVYGYDHKRRRVGVSKVVRGSLTGQAAEVWRAKLDNGEYVIGTPDHGFLLREGRKKPLRDLQLGDSLMPFVKRTKRSRWGTNYVEVYLNNGRKMLAHNLIALDVLGKSTTNGSRLVVHHYDGNGTNNSLSNIEVMSRREHMRLHSIEGWQSSDGRKHHLLWSRSEANKARIRKLGKRKWSVEERKRHSQIISDWHRVTGAMVGQRNSMYGRKHSAAAKRKMMLAKVGYVPMVASWNKGLTKETNESVRRMSQSKLGQSAWNKGKRQALIRIECEQCGKEFYVRWKCKTRPRRFCDRSCAAEHREDQKRYMNHEIVSVEPCGNKDVYNITVEGLGNFALSSGVIVSNSGHEFRVAACFWRDPTMVEYASDPAKDVHRDTAAECFGLAAAEVSKEARFYAKNQFVFPQLYGDYYVNCARNLWNAMVGTRMADAAGHPLEDHLRDQGVMGLGRCDPKRPPEPGTFEERICGVEESFRGKFPLFDLRKGEWWSRYRRKGWFPLMTGFRVSGVYNRKHILNYPVQGPAFHCLLWSLIRLNRWLVRNKMRSKIIGQIHDSIVTDVHRSELADYLAMVKRIMAEDIRKAWGWIIVPLTVGAEVGEENWFEKREVKI